MGNEKVEQIKNLIKTCEKSELEGLKTLIEDILEEMQIAEQGNLLDNQ